MELLPCAALHSPAAPPGGEGGIWVARYLLTDVVIWQVDNRPQPLQHVEDHLPVTALCQNTANSGQPVPVGRHRTGQDTRCQGTWKRATLLTML